MGGDDDDGKTCPLPKTRSGYNTLIGVLFNLCRARDRAPRVPRETKRTTHDCCAWGAEGHNTISRLRPSCEKQDLVARAAGQTVVVTVARAHNVMSRMMSVARRGGLRCGCIANVTGLNVVRFVHEKVKKRNRAECKVSSFVPPEVQ